MFNICILAVIKYFYLIFCSSSVHVQGICISVALWNTAQGDFPVLTSALSFHPIYQFIYKLFVSDNLFESELCWHQRYLQIFLDMSSSILSICTFRIYAQTEIPNAVLNSSETHAHSTRYTWGYNNFHNLDGVLSISRFS